MSYQLIRFIDQYQWLIKNIYRILIQNDGLTLNFCQGKVIGALFISYFSVSESEVRSVSNNMSHYNSPHYFLLGSTPTEDDLSITGAKLPTVRQVLMCFLSSHASPMTVRAAAKATFVEV